MRSVTLHQALHGYKDGHRALACSIELGAQDAKTLLVLSDVSGPGSRLDASSYLTGYPLNNSGLYALARTWPAPEMPRPGCVWTHTLLIDFADLATIIDPRLFLRCYRRPDAHDSASYKIPFAFDDDPRFASISNKAAELAKTLMAALYRIPCKPVISFDENPAVSEEAVLAIWGQQWARLRRSFRFCTLALSDRSTKDSTFDLQLIPAAMPSAKSRFNGAVEAHKTDREPDWLCVAVDELTTPRPDGLRQFLFQAGSDLQDGRSSFANLCRIFGILERNGGVRTDVETALKLIPEPTDASSARALKGMVARKLFAQKAFSSGEALTYIVEHLDLLDIWSSNGSYVDFGHSLLRDQPRVFAKLAGTDD